VAVVDAEGDRFAMINPRIVEVSGRSTAEEGCLSIPDVYAEVTRPEQVVLEALDRGSAVPDGRRGSRRGPFSEIDHLDGILFLDRLSR
jgi:peptide deformylase